MSKHQLIVVAIVWIAVSHLAMADDKATEEQAIRQVAKDRRNVCDSGTNTI